MRLNIMAGVIAATMLAGCSGGSSSTSSSSTSSGGATTSSGAGSTGSGSGAASTASGGTSGSGSTSSSSSSSSSSSGSTGSSGSAGGQDGGGYVDVTSSEGHYLLTYASFAHRLNGAEWQLGSTDNDVSGGHGLAITLYHPFPDGGFGNAPEPGTYDCANPALGTANGAAITWTDVFNAGGTTFLGADDTKGSCTVVLTSFDIGGQATGTFTGHLVKSSTSDGGEDFSGSFDIVRSD